MNTSTSITLTDGPTSQAGLQFAVTRNERGDGRRPSARRSSRTPASATTSPTTWSTSAGRSRAAGTVRGSRRTARSSSSPSAAVLHYAQEIFEGLKAYRHADGSIWTLPAGGRTPRRMQRSAHRLALPGAAGRALPRLPQAARSPSTATGCPTQPETSLYLRPVHVRQGGVPRCAPGEQGRLLPHRQPRRRLLPRRCRTRSRSGCPTD